MTENGVARQGGPESVSRLLLRNLTEVFDERGAQRRRAAIAEMWASDAVFVDPEGRFVGHAALDAAVESLQRRFPTHRFTAVDEPRVHENGGLLNWAYSAAGGTPSTITGQDVAVVARGRIVALYTYLDPLPAPVGGSGAEAGVREIVEAFFAASAGGDTGAAAALFADEVDWLIPGNANLAWTGPRTRRAEIAEVLGIIGGLHVPGESEAQVDKVLVDGCDAVTLGRIAHTVKATGTHYSMLVAFHFTVRDGKIVRLHMFEDTYLVSKAVGVTP
jgi:hypothetical protein